MDLLVREAWIGWAERERRVCTNRVLEPEPGLRLLTEACRSGGRKSAKRGAAGMRAARCAGAGCTVAVGVLLLSLLLPVRGFSGALTLPVPALSASLRLFARMLTSLDWRGVRCFSQRQARWCCGRPRMAVRRAHLLPWASGNGSARTAGASTRPGLCRRPSRPRSGVSAPAHSTQHSSVRARVGWKYSCVCAVDADRVGQALEGAT